MRWEEVLFPIKQVAYAACLFLFATNESISNDTRLSVPKDVDASVHLELSQPLGIFDPADAIQVFVGTSDNCCEGKSAIAGQYKVEGSVVTFVPLFPFLAGQTYTIKTSFNNLEKSDVNTLTEFNIATEENLEPPTVTAIYPSGPVIPENVLRFYIHFSEPMMPHVSEQFIDLIDASGKADKEAFMSFKQELWNADRTRLTLLMDPGRIKRGVAQNRELGPALNKGEAYKISVKAGWPTAVAGSTTKVVNQSFEVSDPLRSIPDPNSWHIEVPKVGTKDDLIIYFDRPFDRELALTSISIVNLEGLEVLGDKLIEDYERAWRFKPYEKWQNFSLEINIDSRMEDVSGNNFNELLDHKLGSYSNNKEKLRLPLTLAR